MPHSSFKITKNVRIAATIAFVMVFIFVAVTVDHLAKKTGPTSTTQVPNAIVDLDTVPNPFVPQKNSSYKADIIDIGRTARGAVVKKVTFPNALTKEHLPPDAVYMIQFPPTAPIGKSLEVMFEEANNFLHKKGFGYVYSDGAKDEIANANSTLPFNQKFPGHFFIQPEVLNDAQQLADIRSFEAAYNVSFLTAGDRPDTANAINIAPNRIMAFVTNDNAGIDIDLAVTQCGDAFIEGAEQCDDGNTNNGDGCSQSCTIETGYTCSGNPSSCSIGATSGGTGGTSGATSGTTGGATAGGTSGTTGGTTGSPSICGDGILDAGEQCDDGNTVSGDGCSATCTIEDGFACRATGDPICIQKTCSDSDGGRDYYTKGTVNYTDFSSSSATDSCITVDTNGTYATAPSCTGTNCFVRENFCSASSDMRSEVVSCNGYCNDGACVACGNGHVETDLGEQCDNGVALNGTDGNDCRSDCKLVIPPAFGGQ